MQWSNCPVRRIDCNALVTLRAACATVPRPQEATQLLLQLLKDYLERRHTGHDHKKGGLALLGTLRAHPGAAEEPDGEKAGRMRVLEVAVHLDVAMHGTAMAHGCSGFFKWDHGGERLLPALLRLSDGAQARCLRLRAGRGNVLRAV